MSNVELSASQMDFLKSDKDYTLFAGGLGAGKTYVGGVWATMMTQEFPETNGIITANSFKQLRRATLPKFFEILDQFGIGYSYKQQLSEVHLENGVVVFLFSAENYEDMRGPEVGWAWSDECAFYKKEAFDVLMGRIRDKKGPCVWKGTTTPNGYNWLYSSFVEEPLPNSYLVRSKTTDNLMNLSDKYYTTLETQYDSRLARQELEGEFVNLNSGNVYYSFDRKRHVKKTNDRNSLIYIGLDFNVHPLCGVFCVEKDGQIHVVQELYQEDSNTFKAAKEIIRRYPYQTVRIIADDSGTKRKTSSNTTDHEILRRSNLEVIKFRNPLVKDRYNNTNRLFDHNLLVIDPSCKKLIEDLEKLTYDNSDPMLSHVSDALGYVCWHLLPLRKPKRKAQVRYY
jgi:PBSX family phage terminase large subunit